MIAESYGGRDEPVDTLVGSLVDVNVTPVFDPLRVKAVPTEDTYQVIIALAACFLFAQCLPAVDACIAPHWGGNCRVGDGCQRTCLVGVHTCCTGRTQTEHSSRSREMLEAEANFLFVRRKEYKFQKGLFQRIKLVLTVCWRAIR